MTVLKSSKIEIDTVAYRELFKEATTTFGAVPVMGQRNYRVVFLNIVESIALHEKEALITF